MPYFSLQPSNLHSKALAQPPGLSPDETKNGIRELFREYGLRVEGAAGASYVAAKKVSSQISEQTVAILSGGNTSDDIFQKIIGADT